MAPGHVLENGRPPYSNFIGEIVRKGIASRLLPVVTTDPKKLQDQAEKVMNKKGYEYLRSVSGNAWTYEGNTLAFQAWKIVPRVMKPTTPRDLSTTLFGEKYDVPVFMAPVGVQAWFHEEKELATIRACDALNVPFAMSGAASSSIEDVAAAAPDAKKWFQLYWPHDEELTASIIGRAKKEGFKALIITLDTWCMGWRSYDLDTATIPFVLGHGDEVGFSDPVFRRNFAADNDGAKPEDHPIKAGSRWVEEVHSGTSRGWEELAIIKKYWDGPIVLKGILNPEDAKIAVDYGVDGIIVSSHGGRQLDGCISALEALPEIVDAVGHKCTILFDSGIRTGADIFKALALGAKAVMVGRPVMYGLGIDGKEGAQSILAGFLADFDLTMGLAGVKKVTDIDRTYLRKSAFVVAPSGSATSYP